MQRKVFKLSEIARAGALGLCLLLPAATAWAQTNDNNNNAGTNTRTETRDERRDGGERRVADRDGDTHWGWLGLLGLAGLRGVMPRKRAPVVVEERRDVRDADPRDRGPAPPPRR